jgi:hypothetical protein
VDDESDGTIVTAIEIEGFHGANGAGLLVCVTGYTTGIDIAMSMSDRRSAGARPAEPIGTAATGKKEFPPLLKRLGNSFDKLFHFFALVSR